MSRLINRLRGRVYGWFESKDAQPSTSVLPAKFDFRARLALQNLEDRVVPAYYVVQTVGDTGTGTPSAGTGDISDPYIIDTFRSAMTQANTNVGPDFISFASSFSTGVSTIALTSALPATSATAGEDLTITGPGADHLVITRGVNSAIARPFQFQGNNTYVIENMTITGQSGASSGSVMYMASNPNLTINNCNITGNTSTTTYGAIYMFTAGSLTVNNSNISNNTSTGAGAAIRSWNATVTINNTTIANNTSSRQVAISSGSTGTNFIINNSTITGNVATATATSLGYNAGAVGQSNIANTTTITGSIIAGNTAANGTADLGLPAGGTATIDNSVIGVSNTFSFTGTNNKLGTSTSPLSPVLSPLGYFGGPVPTMMPLVGSPALNAYDPGAAGTDGRGAVRPAAGADIGAVERVTADILSNVTYPTIYADNAGTNPYFFTVNYTSAVSTATFGNDDILVTTPNGTAVNAVYDSFTAISGGFAAKYKYIPSGGTWTTANAGLYSIGVVAGAVTDGGANSVPAGLVGAFGNRVGATFTVDTLTDTASNPAVNLAPGAGNYTLRQAIVNANAQPFGTMTNIILPASGTINLLAVLPNITGYTSIVGPGSGLFTIQRAPTVATTTFNDFNLGGINFIEFNLSGVTISKGTNAAAHGTMINTSDETVTLTDVILTGNSGTGAVIASGANNSGSVTLVNSLVANNTSSGNIIGLGNINNFTMVNSQIVNNSTSGGNMIAANASNTPEYITITGSTIANNTTTNSTLQLNMVGAAVIRNTTITANSSTSTNTGKGEGTAIGRPANTVGGIPATITIESSIVAGNFSNASRGTDQRPDISTAPGATVVINNSLIGVADTTTFTTTAPGTNKTGTLASPLNPELSLAEVSGFGGLGRAYVPSASSPALNVGSNPLGLTLDVRGKTRTVGTIDIGSVERQTSGETVGNFVSERYNNITSAAATTDIFVDYYDIDTSTLSTGDVTVTSGSPIFSGTPVFDSFTAITGGVRAKYILTAPVNTAAGWDVSDYGTYTVAVAASEVKDSGAVNFIAGGTVGLFHARVGRTFTVTVGTDNGGVNPAVGAGTGTLRQAIVDANNSAFFGTADTIVFDPLVTVVNLEAALPTISDSVTITGNGSAVTTVQRKTGVATAMNILSISGTGSITVSANGLSLVGNSSSAISVADEIVSFNDLNVTGVNTTSNGGAINFTTSSNMTRLTLTNSNFSGNTAASGGAISFAGFVNASIDKTTIANNSASGSGGGISFGTTASAQSLFLTNSTLSGNTAGTTTANYGGGAISFAGTVNSTNVLIRGSTLSGNKASNGGAILLRSAATVQGTFNIQNSTITANTATNTGTNTATAVFGGGGIAVTNSLQTTTLNIISTIVSGNTAANGNDDMTALPTGVTINSSFNAIGDTDGFTLASSSNDLSATDALIGNLKLGSLSITAPGTTKTHPILAGSTAISKGSNPANITPALTLDQNGNSRVITAIEIGSVERLPIPGALLGDPLLPVVDNTNNPYYFYVTYADDVAISRATIGNGATDIQVTRISGGVFSVAATFDSADSAVDAPTIKAKYSFVPPGGVWDSASAGQYTFTTILDGIKNSTNVSVPVTLVATLSTQIPTTFHVTNTNDSGPGSLRQAILDSNLNSNATDTIVFDAPTFSTPQTITLANSLPTISDSVTITGPNPSTAQVTVAGNSTFRLMEVDDFNTSNILEIKLNNLALTGGSAGSNQGGGIRVSAGDHLTMTDSSIKNSKIAGNGGAIGFVANSGNQLTLTRTVLSGNSSSGAGGAIDGGGSGMTLTVTDSTIANNTASSGGAAGLAGGAALTVNITGSTISGNSASGSGGALRFYGGAVSITNSTLSGNTSAATGGAINFFQVYGTTSLNVRNSTITANKAATNGGGIGRTSTGSFTDGSFTIESSIVAGNTNTATPDMFFALGTPQNVSGDYSLIGVGDVGNFTFISAPNNISGTLASPQSPGLGGLANNGGLTLTHALLIGSAAIDKGSNIAPALTTDQRGSGFTRTDNLIPDIGAYERAQGVPIAAGGPYTAVDFSNYKTSNPYVFTVTYANESNIDFASLGNNDVRVNGPTLSNVFATFVSSSPSSDATTIVATYKVSAPGADWLATDNGTYTITVQGGAVTSGAKSVATTQVGSFNVQVPQNYIVSNNADSGVGSLRQAIINANTSAGLDIITFDPAYFTTGKTLAERTIVNLTALPDFTLAGGGVVMNGPTGAGTAMAFVDANKLGRHFNFSANAAGTQFVISNLTLQNASGTGAGGSINFGDENVTLNNVTLSGNTGGTGGSIYLTGGGSLTLNNTTISGSSSTGAGGAIRAAGLVNVSINNSTITGSTSSGVGGAFMNTTAGSTITVESSTISNNRANSTSFGGGAMYLTAATVNINNSTISGNSSAGGVGGGALYTWSSPGSLTIVSSTISSNTGSNGGAIRMQNSAWPLSIFNSTIADNSATASTTAGGGISTNTGVVTTIDSTVVARNSASAGTANDFNNAGTVNANYSVYSTTPNGTLNETSSFTYTLAEIGLAGSIANNGGSTLTYTYASDSKLIDAGQNTKALATDQRGGSFVRTLNGLTDIGAIERVPGQPAATASGLVNVAADLPGVNNPYTFTVTYTVEAGTNMLATSINNNNNAVRVTGPGGFNKLATWVSSTPNTDSNSIAAVYKFNPGTNPGDPWTASLNGTYTVSMEPNQVKTAITNQFVIGGTLGTFLVGLPLTVVVNTDADTVDADPNVTSLREAITATNNGNGTDIINFDPTFFATAKTITLTSALPVIADAVTINGPASKVTVSGNNTFRVLDTSNANAGAVIAISNMTLTGGSVATAGGGLLINDETVTLTNVSVSGNTSSDTSFGNGSGGIHAVAAAAKLSLINSSVSNNTTAGVGGGINMRAASTLSIVQSTISGNSAANDGGGIYFFSGGSLLVDRSTISGNLSSGTTGGGGIYFFGVVGGDGFKIVNSTISGNSSAGVGGGLAVFYGNALNTMNIFNSTIVGNTATSGGGINRAVIGTMNIESSIITSNSAGTGADVNITAGTGTATYSAIEVIGGTSLDYTSPTNLVAVDSTATALGLNLSLAANGATTTLTHAISGTGKAFNAGSNPDALATDQRGAGFARVVGSSADIGAFEVQGAAPAPVVTGFVVNGNPSANTQRSRLTTIQVNFASAVDLTQFQTVGAVFLTRTGVATNNVEPNGTIVNTGNGLIVTPATGTGTSITLTFQNIDNAGIDNASLSDGRWQLSIPAASYNSPNTPADIQLRRLFGDIDNNGTVDGVDFSAFPPFSSIVGNPFDFDNNDTIDGNDFAAFGGRNGYSLI